VTGACLVVQRAKYEAVGGLDEVDLAIAYNDVDFCLKLKLKGWHNVYAPQAVLMHYESKSRGQDLSPKHIARFTRELEVLQRRWNTKDVVDPMHHPRLDRSSETYRLQF
jgi:GT2 family glycosyltransferase